MKIQLNDEYMLDSGPKKNIITKRKRLTRDGKEVWTKIGDNPNLESAVKGIIRYHINKSEIDGVKAIIDEINRVTTEICEFISKKMIGPKQEIIFGKETECEEVEGVTN